MFSTPSRGLRTAQSSHTSAQFQLRFPSLFQAGHSLTFPCDVNGQVPLDRLSERLRNNYFYARVVVGRDYGWPVVEPALH